MQMNTESISAKQAIAMTTLNFCAIVVVIGAGGTVQQDNWIAILLAMVCITPILLMYARLLKLHPGQDIYGISTELLGRGGALIPTLLFTLYAFLMGAVAVRTFTEFIIITSLPKTPPLVLIFCLITLSVWMIRSGLRTFGRWSLISVVLLISVLMIATLLSVGNMRIENLQPVLSHSAGEIIGSAISIALFPMGQAVLMLSVSNGMKKKEKRGKILLIGTLLLGGGLVLLAFFRNLSVLGIPMLTSLSFPTYSSLRLISIGSFLTRLDALMAVNFVLAVFVHITLCLIMASKGLAMMLKSQENRSLALPCGLLMGALSETLFKDFSQLMAWLTVYPYYLLPLELLLPILLLIIAEVKRLRKKKRAQPRRRDESAPASAEG